MKTSFFAKCFLSLAILSTSSVGWTQANDEAISGVLIHEIEDDFENKKSRSRYYIKENSSEEMRELKFPGGKIPEKLKGARSGSKLKLRGKKSKQEVQVGYANDGGDSVLAFDVGSFPATEMKGTRSVLAVRVNFTDYPATCTDEATIFKNMFDINNPVSTKNFYKTNSQNTFDITGKVTSVKINYSVGSSTTCDLYNWKVAAQNALAAAGHTLSNYQHVMYYLPSNVKCNWAGSGGVGVSPYTGTTWIRMCRQKTIAHELGHNLGMQHASSGARNSSAWLDYGDTSDSLGGQSTNEEYNAAHKYQMGWIPMAKLQTISSTAATYKVSPLNADSATAPYPQIFRVLNPAGADDYYISFRDASGPFDATMPLTYLNRLNITAYDNDSGKVEYTYFLNALGVGGSYTLPGTSVTLKVISQAASHIEFSVNGGGSSTPSTTDITAPTVSLSNPLSGATYSAGASVTATASASDAGGISKVEFYVGGALKCSPTVSPYSCPFLMPTSSSLSIYAKAYDKANNSRVTSTIYIKNPTTTTTDITGPTVSLSNPLSGATYAVGASVTASATASDPAGVSKVDFYVGGILKCSDTISPYSCPFSMPTSSSLSVYAKAYDKLNNSRVTSTIYIKNPTTTTTDVTGPTVSLSNPLSGATYAVGASVTASATASDPAGVSKVDFYVGGILKCSDTISPYSCPFSMPTSSSLSVYAKAYDKLNNSSVTSTIYIKNPTTTTTSDTIAPSIPQGLTLSVKSKNDVTVRFMVSQDNVGILRYEIVRNGVQIGTTTSTSYANNNLARGTYYYQVLAVDKSGNKSALSAKVGITIR